MAVLLLFVGLPVALLGACIGVAGRKWWAGFLGLQILAIMAFTTYLLLLQSGAFAGSCRCLLPRNLIPSGVTPVQRLNARMKLFSFIVPV